MLKNLLAAAVALTLTTSLAMADDARAVIIGTASALTDPLRAPATVAIRSSLLRTGRVRAIVRLPAGLLPTKPRQQLALWVLGPAHPGRTAQAPRLIGHRAGAGADDDQALYAGGGSERHLHCHAGTKACTYENEALRGFGQDLRHTALKPVCRGDDGLALADQRLIEWSIEAGIAAQGRDLDEGKHG